MDDWNQNYLGERVVLRGTGSEGLYEDEYKIIEYPFGNYTIKVKVAPTNEFLGIIEIEVDKDFLNLKQRISSKGYLDVDEFYKD